MELFHELGMSHFVTKTESQHPTCKDFDKFPRCIFHLTQPNPTKTEIPPDWLLSCFEVTTRRYPTMDPNRFLDLLPKVEVIATSNDSLFMAQKLVVGCEECDPEPNRPFSAVLDQVTHRQDSITDYIICEPAKCGRCGAPIIETTLVAVTPSDSDAPEILYFDFPIEETNVVLVHEDLLAEAEQWIASCEHCDEHCEHSFDQIIDVLTECDPTNTDYLMCREATCPRCHSAVTEKTLVSPV